MRRPLLHASGPTGLSSGNLFLGASAGNFTTTGNGNTAVGAGTLAANGSGASNTAVGHQAGGTTTGSYNVFVGADSGAVTAAHQNQVAIGAGARTSATNQMVLGGDGSSAARPALTEVDPGASDTTTLGSADRRWKGLYTLTVVNDQTGTSYTLAASDVNGFLTLSNAAAITVTVPANGTVPLPVGFQCTIAQKGAGIVTFAPASGVTIIGTALNRKTNRQGSGATLIKTGTDEWMLFGDLN